MRNTAVDGAGLDEGCACLRQPRRTRHVRALKRALGWSFRTSHQSANLWQLSPAATDRVLLLAAHRIDDLRFAHQAADRPKLQHSNEFQMTLAHLSQIARRGDVAFGIVHH